MPISFDSIPAALRTPGAFIEFNNELANAGSKEFKILVVGQRLGAGTIAANIPTLVTSKEQAASYFGAGSMLALMLAALLPVSSVPVYAIALDDNGAGAAATGTVVIDTDASKAGTLSLYIGGDRVQVAVGSTDVKNTIATNLAAAINADTSLPVTAAAATDTVTITARHKGEVGNDLDLRVNYYNEELPGGVTLTITAMSGGTANPDIATAIAAMGDEHYNWIACPYTDAANLTALTTELDSRWGPMRQIDARAFAAKRGTLAATSTFGTGLNNPHLTCMGTGISPSAPYIWAAVNCAIASASLSVDPARPLQSLTLPGVKAPALADRFTREERNTLLFDGIATYRVDNDGTVRIERQITTYQTNAAGLPDASYLDINTPETLSRIRYDQRAMFAQKYPRHKLADDGTNYGAGQAVMTPKVAKGELQALYREFELKGWVEDYDTYVANLIVERDVDDRNRLNYRDTPNLVNQLRVVAGKSQFIV